jgi:hypothetical protein
MSTPKKLAENPEDKFEIEVQLGDDKEARKIFVGAGGKDFLIERGKKVVVPRVVLNALDDAIISVTEQDEHDPNKLIMVPRKRFQYSVIRAL